MHKKKKKNIYLGKRQKGKEEIEEKNNSKSSRINDQTNKYLYKNVFFGDFEGDFC